MNSWTGDFMTSFVTWSPSEVKQHRQPLAPRWLKNRRWMNDQLVLPKIFPRKKNKQTPHSSNQFPREISLKKHGSIPRGWFLGWPPWRQPSAMKSFLSWFIGRWMDVFFSSRQKNPCHLIFVDPIFFL